MSTKKKMIVSITSMCVVLLVAVVSVIAVWAATGASVKSNINITYTIKNIEGTMKMRIADRNKTDDSQVTWTSLKTDDGSGQETLTFTGEESNINGGFGYLGEYTISEYSGIQPMTVVEVQMTNTSSTSYFAKLTTGAITWLRDIEVDEAYVVRDYFATGSEVTPKLSQYYSNPENFTKEVVGASGLTTVEYEIKNDGTYCFYLCVISNGGDGWGNTATINFSIELYNAYAGE